MEISIRAVATVHSDFPDKFGIPRQSGLVPELKARVVFTPEFRNPDMLRGLEGFSHLWLIWCFSGSQGWSATVRPPRLGGNRRMGVFATRAPYRPNPLGLSCVRLDRILWDTPQGPVLEISGADLMDGTPVFDIKPYALYADCHPEAESGFIGENRRQPLNVEIPQALLARVPENLQAALRGVLAQDPRPAYQRDPAREYGLSFGGMNVRFRVEDDRLTVQDIQPR